MEMTPEIFKTLSKEEKLEYYQNEVMPKIKWEFNKNGSLYATNMEVFRNNKWRQNEYWHSHLDYCHRIKPEPEYIPFTHEDFNLFLGKIVKYKRTNKCAAVVVVCSEKYIRLDNTDYSYHEAFELFEFPDGSPFGKLKT